MMLRHIFTIAAPVFAIALAGCEDKSDTLRAQWAEIKAQAATDKSPGNSYLRISEFAENSVRFTCGLAWDKDAHCLALARTFQDEGNSLRQGYLIKAFAEGHGDAINAAIRNSDLFNKQALEALLNEAHRPEGNPLARYYAGTLLSEGIHIKRDGNEAGRLLSSAWPAVAQAADAAAQNALASGDAEAAYKWAIRCVSPCSRTVKFESIAKEIGPNRTAAIEAAVKAER